MRSVSIASSFPFVLALALAACADQPSATAQAPAAAASGVQVAQRVCHRVLPVGSNIPVTECGPPEHESTQARDELIRQNDYGNSNLFAKPHGP